MVKAIKVMLIPNNVQKTKMFQYAGVTNGRNSQVGHDGHFNIFKKREVLY